MRFVAKQRRPRSESTVPMINVVFLLLIFFLMTAQIAPPEPFEVSLPSADREATAEGEAALYVSAEGNLAFGDVIGRGAIEAAAREVLSNQTRQLELRADSGVEGAIIAALLTDLATAGVTDVALVTAAP